MFKEYVDTIRDLILSIPLSIFDYILLFSFALYVYEDISYGLIPAGISFIAIVSGFFAGLIFYPTIAKILISQIGLTKGISDAIAFLIVCLVVFLIISAIFSYIRKKYLTAKIPKRINQIGGAIFGTLSFFFISSFAVAVLLSFPLALPIKNAVKNSVAGKLLFSRTQGFEVQVRKVFGQAVSETINFLTIKSGTDQSVTLNFKAKTFEIDTDSESKMIELVNHEREKTGLPQVYSDLQLTQVAREHAKDMLARGYFSHYTKEGLSPFDRMAAANIYYSVAGENLALAPDVQIAFAGLMKSPGHRENILSPSFKKIGAGVIDAGIYGKMFVQEFTD